MTEQTLRTHMVDSALTEAEAIENRDWFVANNVAAPNAWVELDGTGAYWKIMEKVED